MNATIVGVVLFGVLPAASLLAAEQRGTIPRRSADETAEATEPSAPETYVKVLVDGRLEKVDPGDREAAAALKGEAEVRATLQMRNILGPVVRSFGGNGPKFLFQLRFPDDELAATARALDGRDIILRGTLAAQGRRGMFTLEVKEILPGSVEELEMEIKELRGRLEVLEKWLESANTTENKVP